MTMNQIDKLCAALFDIGADHPDKAWFRFSTHAEWVRGPRGVHIQISGDRHLVTLFSCEDSGGILDVHKWFASLPDAVAFIKTNLDRITKEQNQ